MGVLDGLEKEEIERRKPWMRTSVESKEGMEGWMDGVELTSLPPMRTPGESGLRLKSLYRIDLLSSPVDLDLVSLREKGCRG